MTSNFLTGFADELIKEGTKGIFGKVVGAVTKPSLAFSDKKRLAKMLGVHVDDVEDIVSTRPDLLKHGSASLGQKVKSIATMFGQKIKGVTAKRPKRLAKMKKKAYEGGSLTEKALTGSGDLNDEDKARIAALLIPTAAGTYLGGRAGGRMGGRLATKIPLAMLGGLAGLTAARAINTGAIVGGDALAGRLDKLSSTKLAQEGEGEDSSDAGEILRAILDEAQARVQDGYTDEETMGQDQDSYGAGLGNLGGKKAPKFTKKVNPTDTPAAFGTGRGGSKYGR
jgi:hypothetical protein